MTPQEIDAALISKLMLDQPQEWTYWWEQSLGVVVKRFRQLRRHMAVPDSVPAGKVLALEVTADYLVSCSEHVGISHDDLHVWADDLAIRQIKQGLEEPVERRVERQPLAAILTHPGGISAHSLFDTRRPKRRRPRAKAS